MREMGGDEVARSSHYDSLVGEKCIPLYILSLLLTGDLGVRDFNEWMLRPFLVHRRSGCLSDYGLLTTFTGCLGVRYGRLGLATTIFR